MACACSTSWSPTRSKADAASVRVDFYQLAAGAHADSVISALATRLLGDGQRLLVVAADEAQLARLDRLLWDQGPTSFLPHGLAGGTEDTAQLVLLSQSIDAPNGARNLLIADGEWRETALGYDRAFFLFGDDTLEAARLAWKLLAGRDGVERNYWAHEDGRWVKKA
jgi:DNA polymerase-3 subunit chi